MFTSILSPELLFAHEVVCLKGPIPKTKKKGEWKISPLQKAAPDQSGVQLSMAWEIDVLVCDFIIESSSSLVCYPAFHQGNAIELFIDTRNMKNFRSTHRFYHHFLFLPERAEGVQCREITRFRSGDSHPLAAPDLLGIEVDKTKKGYSARIEIAAEALHGYLPEIGARMGFCYCVHRPHIEAISWAFPVGEHSLHAHPHLLPCVRFEEKI